MPAAILLDSPDHAAQLHTPEFSSRTADRGGPVSLLQRLRDEIDGCLDDLGDRHDPSRNHESSQGWHSHGWENRGIDLGTTNSAGGDGNTMLGHPISGVFGHSHMLAAMPEDRRNTCECPSRT
jgi:hypothetical protein